MKFNPKKFREMLDEFMMSDTKQISSGVFTFNEEGFEVKSFCLDRTASSKLTIKKEFFSEYEITENIGIGDFSGFVSAIKKFKNEVEIKTEGNLLTFTENKKVMSMELVDEKFITTEYQELKLDYKNIFNMPIEILKDIFESKKVKGNEESTIKIETDIGKIKYTVRGQYKFEDEFEDESITEKSSAKYGVPFFEGLFKFTKKESDTKFLQIHIGNDWPMKVVKESDMFRLEIVIAPYENDED